jgi:pyruvate/2-oxoglutarate/acetoin dehydrogenase E1 component
MLEWVSGGVRMNLQKGDFVIVILETKDKYKGQIKDIIKDEYIIEICTNKRKSEENEVDIVRVKADKLERVLLFV